MAAIHVNNVEVLDNPSGFYTPFKFQLTFECLEELHEDLEWKMIYVGSAESEEYDQVLETIYVGPVPEGRHTFQFQANAPDVSKIPEADVVGVTIILLSGSYRKFEFVRIGYFVNNDYTDPALRENPPPKPVVELLTRNILASKPRVTRFKIDWNDNPQSPIGNGQLMPNQDEAGDVSNTGPKSNGVHQNGVDGGGDHMTACKNGSDNALKNGIEANGTAPHVNGANTLPGVLDC